jgi:hypothetical protein
LAVDVEGDAVRVGGEQPPGDEHLAAAVMQGDHPATEPLDLTGEGRGCRWIGRGE